MQRGIEHPRSLGCFISQIRSSSLTQPVSLFRHILFSVSPIVPVFACVWEDAGVFGLAVIMRNVQF